MRSADAATVFRVFLGVLIVYGIFLKLNPILLIFGVVLERVIDAADGYLSLHEASNGKLGFFAYVQASIVGNPTIEKAIKIYRKRAKEIAPYGSRLDIAGDRAVEYFFWITFTYLNLVPLFVFLIVVIRHSFVDAMMGARGTTSKMKTSFAWRVYSSNLSRASINVPKLLTFSYLILVYIYSWPLWIGYILEAILVFAILLRGVAGIYDALA
jgi:phosphatidylglycerophosphate synthase